MKHSGQWLVCALASVAFCATAMTQDAPHNPYQGIIDRNVFGLRTPPPPPTNNPEANKPPPPKITLTGIITGFTGNKRALMKLQTPPKPGTPPNEKSLIMTEGQREDEVEVLEINEVEGTVKVNEYGSVTTLELPKAPNSPAPAPVAGAMPAGFAPAAPPAAPAMPNPFNTGGLKTIPTRTLRTPPGGAPGSGAAIGTPQSSTGTGLNFGMANAAQPNSIANEPQMTPEESAIMIEAERQRLQQKGDPLHMLLPPTPLNPTANTVPAGDATGVPQPTPPRPSFYKNR